MIHIVYVREFFVIGKKKIHSLHPGQLPRRRVKAAQIKPKPCNTTGDMSHPRTTHEHMQRMHGPTYTTTTSRSHYIFLYIYIYGIGMEVGTCAS